VSSNLFGVPHIIQPRFKSAGAQSLQTNSATSFRRPEKLRKGTETKPANPYRQMPYPKKVNFSEQGNRESVKHRKHGASKFLDKIQPLDLRLLDYPFAARRVEGRQVVRSSVFPR